MYLGERVGALGEVWARQSLSRMPRRQVGKEKARNCSTGSRGERTCRRTVGLEDAEIGSGPICNTSQTVCPSELALLGSHLHLRQSFFFVSVEGL